MRWLLFLFCIIPASGQALRPGFANLSDRIHHTEFQARLRPETHRVEAYMKMTWRNTTGQELLSIPFHLYLNAFSNSDTTFMKETQGGQLRGDTRQSDNEDGFAFCQVLEIKDATGASLMNSWHVDHDLAELTLPSPLAPGETIELEFFFESKLPIVFARSGYLNTFHLTGQWFPKPGVFINGSWNCWNYYANSEFFADFGTYEAELTVPDEYLVGATGYLVEKTKQIDEKTQEKLTTYHFIAEDVHDFVWTADSNFELAQEDYKGIDIRLLYQKGLSQKGIKNQFLAARDTFAWFQKHVGPYPFSTMTIVQPPDDGDGAGGMEYPTLITTVSFIEPNPFLEIGAMVTIHEIGHNYWQGMLASNEFEESWMDEGINSYTEARIMSESFRPEMPYRLIPGIGLTPEMEKRMGYLNGPDWDPMVRKSWEFMDGSSYATNSYSRPAITLLTAQKLFGMEALDNLLREYYNQWSFKHPSTEDFLAVASSISPELASFLRSNLYSNHTVDLMVDTLSSQKAEKGGFQIDSKGQVGPFVELAEQDVYSNRVILFRKGQLIPPPVDVLLVYEDDSREIRSWQPSENAWDRWDWESKAKLDYVQIDPEYKLLIDLDYTNNTRNNRRDDDSRLGHGVASTFQFLLQIIFPL